METVVIFLKRDATHNFLSYISDHICLDAFG